MNENVNLISIWIMNVFDIYILYRFMHIFFDECKIKKELSIIVYICRYFLSVNVMLYNRYPVLNLVSAIIGIAMVVAIYKAPIGKKVIATVIICMCMLVAEIITAGIVGFSGFDPLGNVAGYIDAYNIVITEILLWIITIIVAKIMHRYTNTYISKSFVVILILVFITSLGQATILFQQKNIDDFQVIWGLVGICIMNLSMIYIFDSLSKIIDKNIKLNISRLESDSYHAQLEILQRNFSIIKQYKHDEKNRMIAIKQMAINNNFEMISEYTDKYIDNIQELNVYSQTDNFAIDSIINYKLSKANDLGIKVICRIAIPVKISIDEDEIVVILGNLLDNAIEAAARVINKPQIEVDIGYERNIMHICVKNTFDGVLIKYGGKIRTRKKDSILHGIGLQSVSSVVEKRNGDISIHTMDKLFCVNVILYL